MTKTQRVVALVSVVLLVGIAVAWRVSVVERHAVGRAVYYCPMHPTVVSDKTGDCPICSMKLVKREEAQAPAAQLAAQGRDGSDHVAKQMQSICYLHNCPKLHEGQPCPMTVVARRGEKVTCPICGTHIAEAASSERKILYWTDPMIPGFKSDKPGKSPMGMDLAPVYEEAAPAVGAATPPAGYAPVLVTPQKQQLIGMKTAPVARRVLTKTIRTAGIIAHDPELYQAQQEFIQASQAWQRAQEGGSTEAVALAQELVDSSRLRLRHLGLSEELVNDVGTWSEPDHRLLLGGVGQYWVYASIYEYELALVHPGQAVTVDVSALPGERFEGTVKALDPMLDPMTRTTRARIIVEDQRGALRPSMYVNVSIVAELGEVVAVPEEAVFLTGERQIVFVDKGQGLFEPRAVTTGATADDVIAITAGLTAGERVVTSGNFLIDSESRLQGALQGMGDGAHQHGQ